MNRIMAYASVILLAGIFTGCLPNVALKILKNDLDLKVESSWQNADFPKTETFYGLKEYLTEENSSSPVANNTRGSNSSTRSVPARGGLQTIPSAPPARFSTLNVLMVPGVRRKHWSNYNPLIYQLTKELGFKFTHFKQFNSTTGKEDQMLGAGEITVLTYTKEGAQKDKTINFYIANWTTVTTPAKDALFQFDIHLNNSEELLDRTYLANLAKREYFMEIFADLALYKQEDYTKAIQHTVTTALDTMANDNEEQNAPLVCIAGSMGSEIAIDAFNHYLGNKTKDGPRFAKNLQQLFMLNNQLVFTKMFDYTIADANTVAQGVSKDHPARIENKVLANLEQLQKSLERTNQKSSGEYFRIVSFYDPNDVFGFELPETTFSKKGFDRSQFINIPINHTSSWTIDAQKLKADYLVRLPLGKDKQNILASIGDVERLNINLGIDGPSEFAKYNDILRGYILHGSNYNPREHYPKKAPSRNNDQQNTSEKDSIKTVDIYPFKFDKENKLKKKRGSTRRAVFALLGASSKGRAIELPYTQPHLPSGSIKGLKEIISENKDTYVLTVHGMGNKTPDHFDNMAISLATKLGFVPNNSLTNLSASDGKAHTGIRFLAFQNSEGKSLTFVIVHWSPISRPVKNQLKALSDAAYNNPNIPQVNKAFIHKSLKDKVIIDGFVDVMLTLGNGDFLDEISQTITRAIIDIHKLDSVNRKNRNEALAPLRENVILISGSLGSKVLYDHLTTKLFEGRKNRSSPTEDQEVKVAEQTQRLIRKTRYWYMFSNQIPMIGLKDMNQKNRSKLFKDQVWNAFEENMQGNSKEGMKLNIIAFHDPNDVLTFRLPQPSPALSQSLSVTNLPLRTGRGFEVDYLDSYEVAKKIDRKLYKKVLKPDKEARKWTVSRRSNLIEDEMDMLNQMQTAMVGKPEQTIIALRQAYLKDREEEEEIFRKNKNYIMMPSLIRILDLKSAKAELSQPYMIRFDQAHEDVDINPRVIEVMAFGLPKKK